MNNNNIDVALWGPAIRTHLWLERVENLKATNKCTFRIFYCGQVMPDFSLPEEIVFAHCEMDNIAPHAEIARRLAVESGAKYIFTYCDDVVLSDRGLDILIEDLESREEETVTGPAFRPTLIGQHGRVGDRSELLNLGVTRDTCLGVIHPFMKLETAKKLNPGVDKRFKGAAFDRDFLLRLHEHENIQFRTCEESVISEDMDVQLNISPTTASSARASRRFGDADGNGHDGSVHMSIWKYDLRNYEGHAERLCENQFFSDDELVYTVYDSNGVIL